jgi:hypothetical protein
MAILILSFNNDFIDIFFDEFTGKATVKQGGTRYITLGIVYKILG